MSHREFFVPTKKPPSIGKPLSPVASLDVRPDEIQSVRALEFESFDDDDWGRGRDTWLKDQNGNLYALCYWEREKKIEIIVEPELKEAREKVDLLLEWLRIPRQYNAQWYGDQTSENKP